MTAGLNATIQQRSELSHGLLILRVSPDEPLPPFKAGQYAVLGLPGTAPRSPLADPEPAAEAPAPDKLIKRAYSIASSSLQGQYLEFYIALVRSGALTPRLFALREGDRIWLGRKIVGMFTLDDLPRGHDVIFVATGTGLAPYLSMLRSAYRFEDGHATVVIHGARTSWDLGYSNELRALDARWPQFTYLPIIDRVDLDPSWPGKVGYVSEHFQDGTVQRALGRELAPDRLGVFLCGNPHMIAGMEKMLTARGFTLHSRRQPGNIIVEKFWED